MDINKPYLVLNKHSGKWKRFHTLPEAESDARKQARQRYGDTYCGDTADIYCGFGKKQTFISSF